MEKSNRGSGAATGAETGGAQSRAELAPGASSEEEALVDQRKSKQAEIMDSD